MPWLNEDTVYPASTGQAGGNAGFLQLPFPNASTIEQLTANFQELQRWANNQPKHQRQIDSILTGAEVPGDGTRTFIGTAHLDSGQTYLFGANSYDVAFTSLIFYSDPLPYGYGNPGIRKWVAKGGGIIPVRFFVECVTVSGDPYGIINEVSFTPRDGDIPGQTLTPLENVVSVVGP